MSYVFWCSKCKVDHAGECPPAKIHIKVDVNPDGLKKANSILEELESLVKALAAGSYNAKPGTLHQCSLNPPCGCGVKVDPNDPSVAIVSYVVTLPTPIAFVPITFVPITFEISKSR